MFHIAYPVSNIENTKEFYSKVLQAKTGRSQSNWMDFNFRWNQITVNEVPNFKLPELKKIKDGTPLNHFGVIMVLTEWEKLKNRLIDLRVEFFIEPRIVFPGEAGEQHSFFLQDPDGYAIEFKGFEELSTVFLDR